MKLIIAAASITALAVAIPFASATAQSGTEQMSSAKMGSHSPANIEWKAGPPSLPAGAKMAVLEGDPTKEGPFVMRLRAPAGYHIPPHTHPQTERVTVISGTMFLAMGENLDRSGTRRNKALVSAAAASYNDLANARAFSRNNSAARSIFSFSLIPGRAFS